MSSPVNRLPFLVIRRLLKLLLALPARAKWGLDVDHGERLPRTREPLILACNHAALLDTVFLILALRPRFTVCGAKPSYFRTTARRFLMAVANILRVDDKEVFLADCRRLLLAGEIVLIYPEMGRNPEGLGAFQTWAAEVSLDNGVPLLPCYLHGTTRGHSGGVRLRVGDRIRPRGTAGELTARLREAISALAQPAGAAETP